MVLRGGYIYGMEVQFDRTLIVDPRKTCALVFPVFSQILTASNYYSGFGEERALVCYHLSRSPPRNLHGQLALQSSKTYWRCGRPDKPPSRISTSILGTLLNKTSRTFLLPFLRSSPLIPTIVATFFQISIKHTMMAKRNPAPVQ